MVVGGGSSGGQIFAELVQMTDTSWVTREPPQFLPDDVNGRVLLKRTTKRVKNDENGKYKDSTEEADTPKGNIVMMAAVKQARDKGFLNTHPIFERLTEKGVVWSDGSEELIDTII